MKKVPAPRTRTEITSITCAASPESLLASLAFSVSTVLSPGSTGPRGNRDGGPVTVLLKGDGVSAGEAEDSGDRVCEVAAGEAEEVESGLPEIWVVRRANEPVRLPVEDVPDPLGLLTVPGTPIPRVEEMVFPGLTLLGTVRPFEACTEGFEGGRTGLATKVGDGRETGMHSSTSTYQAGGSGGGGTGSK